MAKLFSKDYHEHSTSWVFNHAVIALEAGELLHWKYRDEEGRIHMRFYASPQRREEFPATVDLVYDPASGSILSHSCKDCPEDENCRHYLSVLRYAYFNLKSEILELPLVETCNSQALRAPEALIRKLEDASIQIEGIYNPETDKLRIHYGAYLALRLPELIHLSQGEIPDQMGIRKQKEILDQGRILSDDELRFWQYVHNNRAAHSQKSSFYTIYKKSFPTALAYLEKSGRKVLVKETSEELFFHDQAYPLSLRIEPAGRKNFRLNAVIVDELSTWFEGLPTWLFFRNQIYKVWLPLGNSQIDRLFSNDLILSARDLVYYRTLVYHELRKYDIYLDFDERIVLPAIVDEIPKVQIQLRKMDEAYILKGNLLYPDGESLPISVLRFRSPLVRYQADPEAEESDRWYRIPASVTEQVEELYRSLPQADLNRLEEYSELLFDGFVAIEQLKKCIFELSEKDWDIEIEEEIERDFVYKAHLEVELQARQSDEIEWFNYELNYRYKDLSFSHEELRKYFKSGTEYLHTQDGRMIFISNPEVFFDMDKMIARSEARADATYRARLMNIPYYQRLMQDNTEMRILGDEYLQQMFSELLARKQHKEDSLPLYLQTVLRGYQKAGHSWLKMLAKYRLNGILADEMGLGKTVQTLSVLASAPSDSCSLVICPKTLLYNWAAEIEKFHTNIRYLVVEGNREDRQKLLSTPNVQLIIMSYSLVLNEIITLKQMPFHWVILDEAQNIKNVTAQRTSAIKKLQANHRLALSGTPFENDLTELWSIFDFLMPGYLGTLSAFKKEYIHSEQAESNRQRLHKAVSPFILRRIKKDVLLELPDKQEQISWCKLNPLQEKLYLQILDNVRQKLFPDRKPEETNYIHILAALTKLRQVCNHPHLANPDILPDPELSAKLELLMELVQDSLNSGHKILIFSQFVSMLRIIRAEMDKQGLNYAYLDGQTKERMAQVNRFNQDPQLRLFLISLKAGGTGLNLSSANTVILFDPWWNPMVEAQAIDRAHRIGQVNKVNVFRLITLGTVEEKIMKLQQGKRELFSSIIEEGQQMMRTMSEAEIRSLFEY